MDTLPQTKANIPIPKVSPSKIHRIYEDDDFIIDRINRLDKINLEDPIIRISIFEDGHFIDEIFIRKSDYMD